MARASPVRLTCSPTVSGRGRTWKKGRERKKGRSFSGSSGRRKGNVHALAKKIEAKGGCEAVPWGDLSAWGVRDTSPTDAVKKKKKKKKGLLSPGA